MKGYANEMEDFDSCLSINVELKGTDYVDIVSKERVYIDFENRYVAIKSMDKKTIDTIIPFENISEIKPW